MKVYIESPQAGVYKELNVTRVVVNSHAHLMLNRQRNGEWTLIYGKALIPDLKMLTAITMVEHVDGQAVFEFAGLPVSKRTAKIKKLVANDAAIHLEVQTDGSLLVFYTPNMLGMDSEWPHRLRFREVP